MTSVSLPPKDKRTQERFLQRQANFYNQTVEENNDRLNGKTMPDAVRDEIKFIEAELLARFGNDV